MQLCKKIIFSVALMSGFPSQLSYCSAYWDQDPAHLLNVYSVINATIRYDQATGANGESNIFLFIQSLNYTGGFVNPIVTSLTQICFEIYYAYSKSKLNTYFSVYEAHQQLIEEIPKFIAYLDELYLDDCYRTGIACNEDAKLGRLRSLGENALQAVENYIFSGVIDISHLRGFVFSPKVKLNNLADYLLPFGIDITKNFVPLLNHSVDVFYMLPLTQSYASPYADSDTEVDSDTDTNFTKVLLPLIARNNIFPAFLRAIAKNRSDKGVFLNLVTPYWIQGMVAFSGIFDRNLFAECAQGHTNVEGVMGKAVDMLDAQIMSVLIAPPCRLELKAVAQVAALYNITTFTGGGELIGNYSRFPFIIRTGYSPVHIWDGFVDFAERNNWDVFFVIYDDMSTNLFDSQEKTIYADGLSFSLRSKGWSVVQVRHHSDDDIGPNLSVLQKSARIVIIVTNRDIFRKYIIAASDLGLCKGEYAFIALDTFKDKFLNTTYLWQAGDGNDDKVKSAYESVLVVAIADPTDRLQQLMSDVEATFGPFPALPYAIPNYYTASYHDALMLLGQRIRDAADVNVHTWKRDSESYNDFATTLSRFLRGQNYYNIIEKNLVTGDVVIDINGDRLQDSFVYDMQEDGRFSPSFNYSAANPQKPDFVPIRWPSGKAPISRPRCGFQDENPDCAPISTNSILTMALTIGIVVAAVIGVAFYRHRQELRRAFETNWIAKLDDVQYPRDINDWVRRRYTLIDDGAGGLAVSDAVRTAKKALMNRAARGSLAKTVDYVEKLRLSLKKTGHKAYGVYKKIPITVRYCQKRIVYVTPQVIREVKVIRSMKSDDNVIKFIAASVDREKVAIFYEFCAKGTLQDLIISPHFRLDSTMRLTVIGDLLRGLAYIHASPLDAHGRLTSKCIHVDNRFVLKIADYGLPSFFSLTVEETQDLKDTGELWDMLLWTAPEHIGVMLGGELTNFIPKRSDRRNSQVGSMSRNAKRYRVFSDKTKSDRDVNLYEQAVNAKGGSKQGDIFSVAIIMSEVYSAAKPYTMYPFMSSEEIVSRVRDRLTTEVPFRPQVDIEDCGHPELYNLLVKCWSDQYNKRPTLNAIRIALKEIGDELGIGSKTTSIMDVMLMRMEEQAIELQQTIAEKTKSIEEERAKFFQLIAEVLPKSTTERMRHDETIAPELYDIVTILMCDVVNLRELLHDCQPSAIIEFIAELYRYYEGVALEYECITVDVSQALIMIASGLPVRNGIFNAREIARVALTMLFKSTKFRMQWKSRARLIFRMAVNTGPVVAGIIGQMCPKYCVFGETIFVTHRLLAVSKDFQILCSSTACNLMETFGSFVLIRLRDVFLKGKGFQPCFDLYGENASPSIQRLESEFRSAFPDAGRSE